MSLFSTFRYIRYRLFLGLTLRKHTQLVTLGTSPFSWTLDLSLINNNSTIYSAGVGPDISFEKALVESSHARILLFDPTPPAIKTMSLESNRHAFINFFPCAISDRNGFLNFSELKQAPDGSFSSVHQDEGTSSQSCPCRRLSDLMQENGHDHIDLLKMDVEGSEYGVIKDICNNGIAVKQICVEFHHWLKPNGRRMHTIWAILQLLIHGYKLVNINGWDHTFIKY